ncbi:MAG: hypothetical protein AB1630_09750 [bacterium]
MLGLSISELIGSLYFFYLYFRITRIPEILVVGLLSLYISYLSIRDFFDFLPRLLILFSLLLIAVLEYRAYRAFDKRRKEIKNLLPTLKQKFIIVSKSLAPSILISHLAYFSFDSSALAIFILMVGWIGAEFLLWRNFPPEGQELYFRPKGKKTTYIRFIESIVFTIILVASYEIICNKLNIKLY